MINANTILKRIKNISYDNKSILKLVGGTASAQLISFLFSPIITRLFSPEVFGDFSVFTSITGIFGIIVCFRYELAIVLPQNDEEGFSLLKISLFFTVIVSTITGLVFFIFGRSIYENFGVNSLAKYWYYVPINLFLVGIIQASNYWLVRTRQFAILSLNKVVPMLVVNILSILIGLSGNTTIEVKLFTALFSYIVNIVIIGKTILSEFKKKYKRNNINDYKKLILRYKNFLVFDIWGALLNNLSWMIVPILLSYYYSSNIAGQYSIGLRVIQIPASLIGASISQIFLKNASEKHYIKNLYPYCIETTIKLFKYTAPMVIVLFLCGKLLFNLLFGNAWSVAGVYVQIMAPWALLWFIASPMHSVFMITHKQKIYLVFSILNLITRFISLYLGKRLNSDVWGIVFFSISGFILYGISLILAFNEAKKSDLRSIIM